MKKNKKIKSNKGSYSASSCLTIGERRLLEKRNRKMPEFKRATVEVTMTVIEERFIRISDTIVKRKRKGGK